MCRYGDVVCVLNTYTHIAVRHDELIGISQSVGAAVCVGEDNSVGRLAAAETPDIDLKLNACAAAVNRHAGVDSGNIEEAVGSVGAVEHYIVIDIELDSHVDCEVRHYEGAVIRNGNGYAAVADLGDKYDVVIECLGGCTLYLDGLADLCGGDFLAVNKGLEGTLGVVYLVDLKCCIGGGLDNCNHGDGAVRHGEAHLVHGHGLCEVLSVDNERFKSVVLLGSYGESDAVALLCVLYRAVTDLCGDGRIGNVGVDSVAGAGLVVGVNLEDRSYGDCEVRHCELAALYSDGIDIVIISNSDVVKHEAVCRSGLDGNLSTGVCLGDGGVVDHCYCDAVYCAVNSDLVLLGLLEGYADYCGVCGHDEAVVCNSRARVRIADLDNLDGVNCITGVRSAHDADGLAGGCGLDALAVDLQIEAAVCRGLADEVIVAGGVDRAGGRGVAVGVDRGGRGYNAGDRDVESLANAEVGEIGSVVECLQHSLRACVVQAVVGADNVVCALTGCHGVCHDGGVAHACNAGAGGGQEQSLADLDGVNAAEAVELYDLIGVGLVAQAHVGVDLADGVAALNRVCNQVICNTIAGRQ